MNELCCGYSSTGPSIATPLIGFGRSSTTNGIPASETVHCPGSATFYGRRFRCHGVLGKRQHDIDHPGANYSLDYIDRTGSEPGVLNPGTLFVFDPARNNARVQRAVNGCPTAITEASGSGPRGTRSLQASHFRHGAQALR